MNEKELRAVLARHGDTAKTLAENLGITEQTLSAKIRGIQDFWRHEIVLIKKRYRLTKEEVDTIFFASEVSNEDTTNEEKGTVVNNQEVTA